MTHFNSEAPLPH